MEMKKNQSGKEKNILTFFRRTMQRFIYGFSWIVFHGVTTLFFRVTIIGKENLPHDSSYLLAPLHRSMLDIPIVTRIAFTRLRFMGKASLWKHPIGSWLATTMGGFPVERGSADRQALLTAIGILEQGEPLVMFPEGTRGEGPTVQPLYPGVAYVAGKAGVPIIPLGTAGTDRADFRSYTIFRRKRIALVIGKPIEVQTLREKKIIPKQSLKDATEELSQTLQRLTDLARKTAK